jgi:hypothetical protein
VREALLRLLPDERWPVRDVLAVPGATADTPLVAVSRGGVDPGLPLAAHWGPADLVRAWAG